MASGQDSCDVHSIYNTAAITSPSPSLNPVRSPLFSLLFRGMLEMGHTHSKAKADCHVRQARLAKIGEISPSLLDSLNRDVASLSPLLTLREKISAVFLHGGEQAARVAQRLDLYRRRWQVARNCPRVVEACGLRLPPHPKGCVIVRPPHFEWLADSDISLFDWHAPMVMVDLFWHFALAPERWEGWRISPRGTPWGTFESVEDWRFPLEGGRRKEQIADLLPTFDGHVAAARERGETAVMMVAFHRRIVNTTGGIEPDGARLRPNWGYGFTLGIGPEGVIVWMAKPFANKGGLNHYIADGHARLLRFYEGRRTVELIQWLAGCRGEWDEEKIEMYVELMRGDEEMFQHHRRFAGSCVLDDSFPLDLFIKSVSDVTYEGVAKFVWLSAGEEEQRQD